MPRRCGNVAPTMLAPPSATSFVALLGARSATEVANLGRELAEHGLSARAFEPTQAWRELPPQANAAIIFADAVDAETVITTVDKLSRERPALPVVLLSDSPAFLHGLLQQRVALLPIVLQATSAGSVIVDAVRELARANGAPITPSDADSCWVTHEPGPAPVVAALRAGRAVPDARFDQFLPGELRLAAYQFWTPLAAAQRAAAWLEALGVETVVDIGSGAGKFCIVGALASRCTFIGIEQRPNLIEAADELARLFGVEERVCFIDGTFGDIKTPRADCYFLFNPFAENLLAPEWRLDSDVELSQARYRRDLSAVQALAAQAAVGTYFLTYNGFGGDFPASFEELRVARDLPATLRLWRKGL